MDVGTFLCKISTWNLTVTAITIVCILLYFSYTAAHWLANSGMTEEVPNGDLQSAMKLGIKNGKSRFHNSRMATDCAAFYPYCLTLPESYRFPGVKESRDQPEADTFKSHQEMASETIRHFLKIAEEKYSFEQMRLNATN